MFEKINRWYHMGLWTDSMVQAAVTKGVISEADACEILGIPMKTGELEPES